MSRRRLVGCLVIVVCLLAVIVTSLSLGAKTVPSADLLGFISGADTASNVILSSRVDRTVVALVSGAALALSGAVLQGLTRNPLADSGLLGINSGAGLAVVIGLTSGVMIDQWAIVMLSLLGALTTGGLVAVFSSRTGHDPVTMLLFGAAVTAGCFSLISAITLRNRGALELMRFWQVGGVGGREIALLLPSLPLLALGAAIALSSASTLNTLAVGDDLASALGSRPMLARARLALSAMLLAAGGVAVVGPIGFLGLAVPHAVRLLLGQDYRRVLPGSLILGPALLLAADVIGRIVMPPAEVSAGLIVLIIGAPVLLVLVRWSVRA